MIRTILVAVKGEQQDRSVFATAFALARLLKRARLDFFHIRIAPDQSAAHQSAALGPHVDFARGRALRDALDCLQRDAEIRSAEARRLSRDFCARNDIPTTDLAAEVDGISAGWVEQQDNIVDRFIWQARHHDLVVVGRPHESQDCHRKMIEQLVLSSGRPTVVAPSTARELAVGVAVVGWKETREAAQALSAAMPILVECPRVVITDVDDHEPAQYNALADITRLLARHGVVAEAQIIRSEGRPVAQCLDATAQAVHADLLIIGAYGRSRIRELIFGDVTHSFLESASIPIFLAH